MARLSIGALAPDFSAPDQTGRVRSLGEFHGQWLVLYFYPKDETPGCVAEACAFRDRFGEFEKVGATILGVSADSTESHKAFIENRRLPFPLLADTRREMIRAYGADMLFGTAIRRKTVVIDGAGVVRGDFENNVRAEEHVPAALAIIEEARR